MNYDNGNKVLNSEVMRSPHNSIPPKNGALSCTTQGAFDSAKNHKHQRRKRQSATAKREKSQTPKFV